MGILRAVVQTVCVEKNATLKDVSTMVIVEQANVATRAVANARIPAIITPQKHLLA